MYDIENIYGIQYPYIKSIDAERKLMRYANRLKMTIERIAPNLELNNFNAIEYLIAYAEDMEDFDVPYLCPMDFGAECRFFDKRIDATDNRAICINCEHFNKCYNEEKFGNFIEDLWDDLKEWIPSSEYLTKLYSDLHCISPK